MLVERAQNGAISLRGDPDFPVSRGQLCIKGAEAAALQGRSDRLLSPLVRGADGELHATDWETALARVAEGFKQLRANYGSDSLGVFGSGGLSNEKAYALGKFARVALGTRNIDYNGRYCMSSAAAAQKRSFGVDRGMPFPVSDIADADCVVSWGLNWVETMPTLRQWFEQSKARGGRSIVVDPRRSETAMTADLHLQLVPGTDLALANGLLYLVFQQKAEDRAYILNRTLDVEAVKSSAQNYPPERVERITGISEGMLRRALLLMLKSPNCLLLSGRGPEQQSKGVDTVSAMINLMLALGKVGRSGSGYGTVTGQGNGQGGREHGQKADQLPGARSIEDPAHRSHVEQAWGLEPGSLPGKGSSAYELLSSLGVGEGRGIRGMLVMGSNVAVASPNANFVEERLRSLELLVVVDTNLNETAALAHVVLPSLIWSEEAGTVTNLEGRVLLRRQVVDAPEGPRSDLAILKRLAELLGSPNVLGSSDPRVVFDELALVTRGAPADYSGLSHGRLGSSKGIHWPCPSEQHPGTPRMFLQRFAHPDGKARFVRTEYRDAAELPDADFPLYLTTGRYREQYNSGAQTRGVESLNSRRPEPLLEVHPSCLERFNLAGAPHVMLETRRGQMRVRVRASKHQRVDTLFVPFHYGGAASVNRLTSAALDPLSRMPEFKICAARLKDVEAP